MEGRGVEFMLRLRWWYLTTGEESRDSIHRVVCALVAETFIFTIGVIQVIG